MVAQKKRGYTSGSSNRTYQNDNPRKAPSIINPANALTCVRILFIPIFMVLAQASNIQSETPNSLLCIVTFLLYALLCATDKVDGYLARSRNQVTDFGKFLDPIADKIIVFAALLLLLQQQTVNVWWVFIILLREFLVSALRMLAATKGIVIAADLLGKVKTVFTMFALAGYYLAYVFVSFSLDSVASVLFSLSDFLMIIAVIITVLSGIQYFYNGRRAFR